MSSRDTAAVSLTSLPEFRGPGPLNAPRKARTSGRDPRGWTTCVIPRETWNAATVPVSQISPFISVRRLPHVSASRAFAETGYLGRLATPARVCLLAQLREQNRRRFDARKGQN